MGTASWREKRLVLRTENACTVTLGWHANPLFSVADNPPVDRWRQCPPESRHCRPCAHSAALSECPPIPERGSAGVRFQSSLCFTGILALGVSHLLTRMWAFDWHTCMGVQECGKKIGLFRVALLPPPSPPVHFLPLFLFLILFVDGLGSRLFEYILYVENLHFGAILPLELVLRVRRCIRPNKLFWANNKH